MEKEKKNKKKIVDIYKVKKSHNKILIEYKEKVF